MKKSFALSCMFVLTFSSCARYHARPLCKPSAQTLNETPFSNGLVVAARAFSKADCKRYLDRDLLSKGYQPVQLYIENMSEHSYVFSLARISLPTIAAEEVARRMHNSTVGRIAGYGAAALIASPLFAVPAIVDGFQALQANETLDTDFASKAAKDRIIEPHSHANMVLFVPKANFRNKFTITLVDEETRQPVHLVAHTR